MLWLTQWPKESVFDQFPAEVKINISSTTNLGIALRNQRNLRKIANATTEEDIINFYYTLIDSLIAITNDIVLNMPRFKGWSEALANQRLFQAETNAQKLYVICKKFYREGRKPDYDDFIMQTLLTARINYEQMIDLTARNSEFTMNEIESNFTQLDPVRAFQTAYTRIIQFDYSHKELSEAAFDESFTKTRESIDWLQEELLRRVGADITADTQSWSHADVVCELKKKKFNLNKNKFNF